MSHQSGIYEIVNTVNDKRYIGSAVSIARRFNQHKHRLRKGTHHSVALQRAWNKYREEAFKFQPVLLSSRENLIFYEQLCMDALQPEYNIEKIANSSLGRKATPRTKAKISAALKGNKSRLGHKHTPERKAQISQSLRGRIASPATLAKRSASLKGKRLTAETKEKLAAAQRGRTPSAATRIKLSESHKGITPSVETREKMSASAKGNKGNTGRRFSDEHRAKLSAATTAFYAKRSAS